MRRNLLLIVLLTFVVLVALAIASRAEAAAAAPPARAARVSGAVKSAPPAAGARAAGAPRTLDAIHIEGEIPVPQVLFITAREQRRFVEFQHRRYLRTSRQLGEATVSPDWIVVNPASITPAQEKAR